MFLVITALAMTLPMLLPSKEAPIRNSATRMLLSNNNEMVAHVATTIKERVWMLMKLSQRMRTAIQSRLMISEVHKRLVLNVYMLASNTALLETTKVPSSK